MGNRITWLITPPINFSANSELTLNFQTSNSFADNSKLELLYSNDWNGITSEISNATWVNVSEAYITKNSDSFSSWISSGLVDLSCGSGTAYIAFKYTGSGYPNSDGTYQLDNVKITSK